MEIALIGYGKMGKAIEEVALQRGHRIALKISSQNQSAFSEANLQLADVAIEFSNPSSAYPNVLTCISSGIPVVCGTTGWNDQLLKAQEICQQTKDGALLYASNFSIGVNLFFELNQYLAELMKDWKEYEVEVLETHHIEKKDAPSGTAITLAEQILEKNQSLKGWQLQELSTFERPECLPIRSFREDQTPGTHQVQYKSFIDDIEIRHTAHSRMGFALGAVLAAEFLKDKRGLYSMKDVLFPKSNF